MFCKKMLFQEQSELIFKPENGLFVFSPGFFSGYLPRSLNPKEFTLPNLSVFITLGACSFVVLFFLF